MIPTKPVPLGQFCSIHIPFPWTPKQVPPNIFFSNPPQQLVTSRSDVLAFDYAFVQLLASLIANGHDTILNKINLEHTKQSGTSYLTVHIQFWIIHLSTSSLSGKLQQTGQTHAIMYTNINCSKLNYTCNMFICSFYSTYFLSIIKRWGDQFFHRQTVIFGSKLSGGGGTNFVNKISRGGGGLLLMGGGNVVTNPSQVNFKGNMIRSDKIYLSSLQGSGT